ncbi:type VI secretion system contractile sheath large subunit [Methylomicrobium sp. Wu6]|uniref:type VI secretion system contractile sheath domain-containing protein n=1 Tax=Methylomicrobium sp. Wu6 TaxID=3107928 RepID=UPI002DD642B3|nr:type VI secretion system contractile sheath large subunit [Methylomicrobium sp. Wu6]MEC4750113.1 type VI secretion system contractile sheath large subunit [Methylomicrobium sp. Wu6]
MRILVLGDFSGRSPYRQGLEGHSILRVDIDNFDAVMARIAPRLHLQLDTEVDLTFRQMEDFHPDTLFQNLELFRELARIRDRLSDAATFTQAAEELRGMMQVTTEKPVSDVGRTKDEDDQMTFERLLGGQGADREEQAKVRAESIVENTLEQIVARHIVADAPPFKDIYLNAVDEALSAKMRELLHHPDFQALEAAWKALWALAANLETGENLSLHVLDVSKDELFDEVSAAGENLSRSGLYRLLVDQNAGGFGGEPWSVVIGNFSFGNSPEDVALLAACGLLAAKAGGPFIAAADPVLLGCGALAESPDPHDWAEMAPAAAKRWDALRQSPVAPWIGLVLPRILSRLPYGRETDPVESFAFEEAEQPFMHEFFLWANPVFYCALLLGRSYLENGGSMQPGDHLQIDDLPAYIFKQDGNAKLLPCAEVCLNDRAMEKILALGVMPFLSHRSGNIARLARFQSLADPTTVLQGFWSH